MFEKVKGVGENDFPLLDAVELTVLLFPQSSLTCKLNDKSENYWANIGQI